MSQINLKINAFAILAQLKVKEFFSKEDGDVNIVSIVVLIGIAVLLAVIFKDRITDLIGDLFDIIDSSAQEAIS